jgi:spore germination protein GerM
MERSKDKAAVLGLIAGTNSTTLSPSMPEGTRLLSINLDNGLCTVDFSRAFIENHSGGSAGELMTLSSIVNTLTEFPEINRVQILVEGQAGETIGNMLLDEPLYRFEDLIGL